MADLDAILETWCGISRYASDTRPYYHTIDEAFSYEANLTYNSICLKCASEISTRLFERIMRYDVNKATQTE